MSDATPGQLLVTCQPVAFAARYRFWTQEHGSLVAPVAAGSGTEPMCNLGNLPGNTHWNVWVSAVNILHAEGPRSSVAEARVLPVLAAAA